MSDELHAIPVAAVRMLDDLGPLLGGRVVCVVVLNEGEIHLMFPGKMLPDAIEAVGDAMIAAMLGAVGD